MSVFTLQLEYLSADYYLSQDAAGPAVITRIAPYLRVCYVWFTTHRMHTRFPSILYHYTLPYLAGYRSVSVTHLGNT